jgi:hypothetical protein
MGDTMYFFLKLALILGTLVLTYVFRHEEDRLLVSEGRKRE